MKTFPDVLFQHPGDQLPICRSYLGMHVLFWKHLPSYPRLTMKLSWGRWQCGVGLEALLDHWLLNPESTLWAGYPTVKSIHWLCGAAWLISSPSQFDELFFLHPFNPQGLLLRPKEKKLFLLGSVAVTIMEISPCQVPPFLGFETQVYKAKKVESKDDGKYQFLDSAVPEVSLTFGLMSHWFFFPLSYLVWKKNSITLTDRAPNNITNQLPTDLIWSFPTFKTQCPHL